VYLRKVKVSQRMEAKVQRGIALYVNLKKKTNFIYSIKSKSKAVPLHAMEALGGRGCIAPTHSRPRH
jgi:hypothetical protein